MKETNTLYYEKNSHTYMDMLCLIQFLILIITLCIPTACIIYRHNCALSCQSFSSSPSLRFLLFSFFIPIPFHIHPLHTHTKSDLFCMISFIFLCDRGKSLHKIYTNNFPLVSFFYLFMHCATHPHTFSY